MVFILATLRIRKARDENGHEIEVKQEFDTGLILCVFFPSLASVY